MVKIVTDSTADIPAGVAAELGIGVVPVIVEIDGVTHQDGVTLSREKFYANLDTYRDIPKTAAPSSAAFLNLYRAAGEQGAQEIVSIHLNRNFSALCDVVELAAREYQAESGLPVRVVDSETVTMGLGWLAISAARMARQGASATKIVQRVNAMRPQVYIYALVDTLRYLRRSGRANALTAGIGDMLQIKVLLGVHDATVAQIERIRTRARGISRMLEVVHRHTHVQHLSVLHTSNGMDEDVQHMRQSLSDLCPLSQQFALQVTPVIGAHVGPQAVGVALVTDV
jgi:DegV family protein with EDD domain